MKTKHTDVGPGVSTASPSGRADRPTTPKPVGSLGTSWTVNWLEFDNSYFTEVRNWAESAIWERPGGVFQLGYLSKTAGCSVYDGLCTS